MSAERLTDNSLMPFGKHRGRRLEDVPASYLLWLWDEGWWQRTSEPLGAYLLDALSALQHECRDYIIKHPPAKR